MTATINIVAITGAIEGITVTGLTISDWDTIQDQTDVRAKPVLFPDPVNSVTNMVVTNDTWGLESAAEKSAAYDLRYVLAYEKVGTGRGLKDILPGLIAMVADIVEAVTATELGSYGAITSQVLVPNVGIIQDPAGNQYHGALVTIRVLECIQ